MTSLAEDCRALLKRDFERKILTAVIGCVGFGALACDGLIKGDFSSMGGYLGLVAMILSILHASRPSRAMLFGPSDEQVVLAVQTYASREHPIKPGERRIVFGLVLAFGVFVLYFLVSEALEHGWMRMFDTVRHFAFVGVWVSCLGLFLNNRQRRARELHALFPTELDGAEPPDGLLG